MNFEKLAIAAAFALAPMATMIPVTCDTDPTGAVPEPATWAMLIAGFGLVGGAARRRRARAVAA